MNHQPSVPSLSPSEVDRLPFDAYYQARDFIEDLLRRDLVGPDRENETVEDRPLNRYLTGILYPQGMGRPQSEVEQSAVEDPAESSNYDMNLCYARHPSSLALSFTLRPEVSDLIAYVDCAVYRPDVETSSTSAARWTRSPISWSHLLEPAEWFKPVSVTEGLQLRCYLQKQHPDGEKTITVALVNTQRATDDRDADNCAAFFQARLRITGPSAESSPFVAFRHRVDLDRARELLRLEMLYRHKQVFGAGHGCSVHWRHEGQYASELFSEIIPRYDLLQLKPAARLDPNLLSYAALAELDGPRVVRRLGEMASSYSSWIEELGRKSVQVEPRYREAAEDSVRLCHLTLERIRAGIRLLESDDRVMEAFRLANLVLLYLREKEEPDAARSGHRWYPFQLAFVLQTLPSIGDVEDPYREVVDLLWFPTGGGKTEAYLALAAIAIFLRRMRGASTEHGGRGVTVLMRYTLRLLTLQQMARAARMICACEVIRRARTIDMGAEEISVGFFVGEGMTPNRRGDARKALHVIREGGFDALGEDANPCLLTNCPWCGAEVKPIDYAVTEERMIIRCPAHDCDFRDGLPVHLIDDDVYDHLPSFLIGTVDKFALMPWQRQMSKLFGLGAPFLPPELIIQDELHLISGPLGTIVGLYESAVDEFCASGGHRAKVVASTATIRNAGRQILNLFARRHHEFPPQGLDIRDSYFAEEAAADERPARRYLGVMAPGSSGNTMLIRVYAVLLFASRALLVQGYDDRVMDTYWTMVGYFNSLRQLGGALVNVLDDVHARLRYLQERYRGRYDLQDDRLPLHPIYDELTSRMPNREIAVTLKRLGTNYPSPGAYDVVLASNMLSVGIDIQRLGLMVLQGQPKLNAEYIQATSRVGRSRPGLVVCMYGPAQSRDRSHYEHFVSFHSSPYLHVEASSLTPFAERARERAMHAVLVALARHMIDGLGENADAKNVEQHLREVGGLVDGILRRVGIVDPLELEAARGQLNELVDQWRLKAGSDLAYRQNHSSEGLLTGNFEHPKGAWPTLSSMRNVDAECPVELRRRR
jgi:hypothetical protein